MHELTDQRNTNEIRLREYYYRASNAQASVSTSLCQIWINFEERTVDIHIPCTILNLDEKVAPKFDNSAVR